MDEQWSRGREGVHVGACQNGEDPRDSETLGPEMRPDRTSCPVSVPRPVLVMEGMLLVLALWMVRG